jgi:hypothetical protein
MVGTPALFELAFTYSHRSELESLLLRLQVAINAAHLQDTRECLTLVRPDMLFVAESSLASLILVRQQQDMFCG